MYSKEDHEKYIGIFYQECSNCFKLVSNLHVKLASALMKIFMFASWFLYCILLIYLYTFIFPYKVTLFLHLDLF